MEPRPSDQDHALRHTSHRYGSHALQRIGVWEEPVAWRRDEAVPWVVFIHGGAWGDPRRTLYDFEPSIRHLREDGIRGFASIDYRLSPHPDYPQDPTTTAESELRDARHPLHLRDVRAGLRLLLTEYSLITDHGYVLVGHSAGATLALQLLLLIQDENEDDVPPPLAVVAIAGIYDLVGLNDRFTGQYTDFMTAAFGPSQDVWRAASPIHHVASWPTRIPLILAHSPDDDLVDATELRNMAVRLADAGVDVGLVSDLVGDHDAPWREGLQVVDLVRRALERCRPS
ncbi:hypothetical protein XA68_15476 [Ophiocordyceps unilateralis]|uniref:Kynurenine formamidase n=1 Tax=Ophiocordyceps unilateralis TaxID=268505 RepID=A0A2A9P8H3_OPHUN|nr:hypothetical protein XA68_15476 [Ophiocordyceps unilateralis]